MKVISAQLGIYIWKYFESLRITTEMSDIVLVKPNTIHDFLMNVGIILKS